MKFTKMHGIGNDYVYMDCTKEASENPEELARLVSDRHKGIGADGLILIKASEQADFGAEACACYGFGDSALREEPGALSHETLQAETKRMEPPAGRADLRSGHRSVFWFIIQI